jgi:hypothetical protein
MLDRFGRASNRACRNAAGWANFRRSPVVDLFMEDHMSQPSLDQNRSVMTRGRTLIHWRRWMIGIAALQAVVIAVAVVYLLTH